jgi:sugar (pentulose or hexulose) kinase
MATQDDLATLTANNQADAAALTSLEQELNTPAVPSVGDNLLAAVVANLVDDGYTVTPPATTTSIPVTDVSETETPAEDTTDAPAEG